MDVEKDEDKEIKLYKAEDLIEWAVAVLTSDNFCKAEGRGFPRKQALAAARVLVEADLRGDKAHGLAGGSSLDDIFIKVNDDREKLGFKRIEIAEYSVDNSKHPTMIYVDAHGTLGHYVAWNILPRIIETAETNGPTMAFIRNSTHFGDCGIYSEELARNDLIAMVTCTSPQWTKPFVELQDSDENSTANRERYEGVRKRFGTNPMAWSTPYEGGIVTIDMAATQRAVSPAIDVAKDNRAALNIYKGKDGSLYVGAGGLRTKLKDVHLDLARSNSDEELYTKLRKLGYDDSVEVYRVEEGLLKGPNGENINYPLAFDEVFKQEFWIAPLGGTYYGYKGFGINMTIELQNVFGGGVTGLIRVLNEQGNPTTPERVSQTILAIPMNSREPVDQVKARLKKSVDTTMQCSNGLVYLPGQKEQESRECRLVGGVPYDAQQRGKLKKIGHDVGMPFEVIPVK
ncbi:Ldh family oxidoreductase [Candidatus Woesearchaeota archaeon]|nr:Ldh family oxidoreductase [Candidatus Woesearchaeota archaeon]